MDESLSAAKGAGFERGGAGAEKGDMVMKAKIILMLLAVLLLAGQRVTYAAAATRTNIEINLGEEVVIVLEANHTTGYCWLLGGPVDKEILEFSEIRYETGNTKLIGAGGRISFLDEDRIYWGGQDGRGVDCPSDYT